MTGHHRILRRSGARRLTISGVCAASGLVAVAGFAGFAGAAQAPDTATGGSSKPAALLDYQPASVSGSKNSGATPTTTSVTSSENPARPTDDVTFEATVSAAGGTGSGLKGSKSNAKAPAGTVQFKIDGVALGAPVTLTSAGSGAGAARSGSTQLTVAGSPHAVTAEFVSSDSKFSDSTGELAGGQFVTNGKTTTTLASSANPSVYGQTVSLTATVSAKGAAPAGKVSFLQDGTAIGTAKLSPPSGGGTGTGAGTTSGKAGKTVFDSTAVLVTSQLPAGEDDITAGYGGKGVFETSSATLTGGPQVVSKAATTASLGFSASGGRTSPVVVGQPVTYVPSLAVVAPGGGTPTGTFSFTNDGRPVAGCTALSVSSGSCTIAEVSAGTHVVTVAYSGDPDFSASSATESLHIVAASTSTALSISPGGQIFGGEKVTLSAAVSVERPGSGEPTGRVIFMDGRKKLGSSHLTAVHGGAVTLELVLAPGSHDLSAAYGGASSYSASTSAAHTLGVLPGSVSVSLRPSPSAAVAGRSVVFTVTLSPEAPSTQPPAGTVSLFDGSEALGAAKLPAAGAGSSRSVVLGHALPAGEQEITARYTGDSSYRPTSYSTTLYVAGGSPTQPAAPAQAAPAATQSLAFTGADVVPLLACALALLLAGFGLTALSTARRRSGPTV